MSKNRKAKVKLTPLSWVWLAKTCAQREWERVQDLAKISAEAAVAYVQALTDAATFEGFEETFRPEVVAARRKAEAEKKEAEERDKRTIHHGLAPSPYLNLERGSVEPIWRAAQLTEAERKEAEERAEQERTGMRAIPVTEWEPEK